MPPRCSKRSVSDARRQQRRRYVPRSAQLRRACCGQPWDRRRSHRGARARWSSLRRVSSRLRTRRLPQLERVPRSLRCRQCRRSRPPGRWRHLFGPGLSLLVRLRRGSGSRSSGYRRSGAPYKGSGAAYKGSSAGGSYRAGAPPTLPARLRPRAAMPEVLGIGVPDRLSTGTLSQAAGHKHSGLHPRGGGRPSSGGGWDRPAPRRDGPGLERGGPGMHRDEEAHSDSDSGPIPSSIGHAGTTGRNLWPRPPGPPRPEPAARGEFAGGNPRAPLSRVAGQPCRAARRGRRQPGGVRVVPASPLAAEGGVPNRPVGVVLRKSGVNSGVTRSRVVRPCGNCLRHVAGQCTRSG